MMSNDEMKKELTLVKMKENIKKKFFHYNDINSFDLTVSESADSNELTINFSYKYWYSEKYKHSITVDKTQPNLELVIEKQLSNQIDKDVADFNKMAASDQDAWKNDWP